MRAIMYHYVMPRDKKIPNLHRLDIDSFKKQLDYFKSNYGFIDKGEFVHPGQRLILIHNPNNIWVEANIKETELRHIKLGMTAKLKIDAYPNKSFIGKVERIGQAATGEFALLPNPNPSGNFTKVTQRLPIRISVEQEDDMLRPGMLVVIEIDIPGR